jgi:hypothetical protein
MASPPDRVPEGCTYRFRRHHNADGATAMEYWLEPAELADIREEAGVSDPYWVPPPGWKLGDDVSSVASDLLVKRQLEELAEEVNGVKRSSFLTIFLSCIEHFALHMISSLFSSEFIFFFGGVKAHGAPTGK